MIAVPATLEDAIAIAESHVRSWQCAYVDILDPEFLADLSVERRAKQWQDILAKQESRTLVVHSSLGVSGFVSFGHWRDDIGSRNDGEIWALYVTPAEWSKGVGSALLKSAVQGLRSIGRHGVYLWVLAENHRGIRFYQNFGFRPAKMPPKTFELGGTQLQEICLVLQHDA